MTHLRYDCDGMDRLKEEKSTDLTVSAITASSQPKIFNGQWIQMSLPLSKKQETYVDVSMQDVDATRLNSA